MVSDDVGIFDWGGVWMVDTPVIVVCDGFSGVWAHPAIRRTRIMSKISNIDA